MSMTNDDMIKEICEHLDLMLSFAEKAGITIDKMSDYSVKRDELSFSIENIGIKEYNDELYENVTIRLNEKEDRVKVMKETKYSHNFIIAADNPDCQDYCTTYHQIITEFLVRDGKLEVTTASAIQTVNGNTYFNGNEAIVYFSSVADFKKQAKLESLPQNQSLAINIKTYSIPENYHITDGVGPIDSNPKVIEKTTQP